MKRVKRMQILDDSREMITFDDVLIQPNYSEVRSRSDVSLSTKLSEWLSLDIPIIASNMDTVCGAQMAGAMDHLGGMGTIHRNKTHPERIRDIRALRNNNRKVGVAVGVNELFLGPVSKYLEAGVSMVVLDIAHGDSLHALNAIETIRNLADRKGSAVCIVGGNVATGRAVYRMHDAGANCVKIGIGPGAACSTRESTGVGVPQLSAIIECAEAADSLGLSSIADGGIRSAGDVAKALAAGVDAVMLGSMLAGTSEAPGGIVTVNGEHFKSYRGMASAGAGSTYVEGVEGHVPFKGSASGVINTITNGLRSSFSYVGAHNLDDFRAKANFVRVSSNAVSENGTSRIA